MAASDLQEFNASLSPRGLPAVEGPSPTDSSGQQLQQAGQAIQNAGESGTAIAVDALQIANRTRVDEAINALRERQLDDTYGENGYTRLRGRDALFRPNGQSLTDEYSGNLDREADSIASGLGNDAQRRAFRRAQQEVRASYRTELARHETGEFQTYAMSVFEGAISTAQRGLALSGGNPEQTAEHVATIRAQVANVARLTGRSAEWVQAQTVTMLSAGHAGAIARFLDDHDPSAAQRYSDLHASEMTQEDLLRVDAAIGEQEDIQIATAAANEQFALIQGGTPPASAPEAAGGTAPRAEGGSPFQQWADNAGRASRGRGAAPFSAVSARIRATEGPEHLGGYNALAYNTSRTQNSRGVPQQNLTSMTIGQVQDFQLNVMRPRTRGQPTRNDPRGIGSTGVGAYQFESRTLAENARIAFGANWRNVPFTPANQDRIAEVLYSRAGLTPWGIGGTGGRVGPGGQQGGQQTAGGYDVLQAVQALRADPRLAHNPRVLAEAERQLRGLVDLQEHAAARQDEDTLNEAYRQMAQNGGHYERLPSSLRSRLDGRYIPQLQSYGEQVRERQQSTTARTEGQSLPIWGQLKEQVANGTITRPEQLLRYRPMLTSNLYRDLVNDVIGHQRGSQGTIDSMRTTQQALGYVDAELQSAGLDRTHNPEEYSRFRGVLLDQVRTAERLKGSALTGDEARDIAMRMLGESSVRRDGIFGWARSYQRVYELEGEQRALTYGAIPPSIRTQIIASLRRRGVRGPITAGDVEREYAIIARASQGQ